MRWAGVVGLRPRPTHRKERDEWGTRSCGPARTAGVGGWGWRLRRVGCVGMLAQLFPVGLLHLDAEFPGCSFDSVEGLLAVFVGDVLDLIESRDGVADVGGVFEGFFALVGEGVVGVVDVLAIVGGEGVGFGWHEVLRGQTSCGSRPAALGS